MTGGEAGGRGASSFTRSLGILPEMALIGCGAALLMGLLLMAAARQNDTAQAAATRVAEAMLRREMAELTSRVADLTWWSADSVGGSTMFEGGGAPDLARRLTERYNVDEALIFPQGVGGTAPARW